jgi:hypothetical protein
MTSDDTSPRMATVGIIASVALTALLVAPTTSWTLRPLRSASATPAPGISIGRLRRQSTTDRLNQIRALRGKYRDKLPSSEEFNRDKASHW